MTRRQQKGARFRHPKAFMSGVHVFPVSVCVPSKYLKLLVKMCMPFYNLYEHLEQIFVRRQRTRMSVPCRTIAKSGNVFQSNITLPDWKRQHRAHRMFLVSDPFVKNPFILTMGASQWFWVHGFCDRILGHSRLYPESCLMWPGIYSPALWKPAQGLHIQTTDRWME